jgi:hypothetical protein
VRFLALTNLPAGDAEVGPSDFLFTAAADDLLLHPIMRHGVGLRRQRVLLLDFEGLNARRWRIFYKTLVLEASTSLQHTLLVADDKVWSLSLRPPLRAHALHFAALDAILNLDALQHSAARYVDITTRGN